MFYGFAHNILLYFTPYLFELIFLNSFFKFTKCSGLMVSVLDAGLSNLGGCPNRHRGVMCLCKTLLYSHSAFPTQV